MNLRATFLLSACLILAGCERLPTGVPEPQAAFMKGMTLADWTHDGYMQSSCESAISVIAATGATHLAIIITGYQSTRSSNLVYHDPRHTPHPTAVQQAVTWAKAAGMKVVLKPQLLARDAAWPGEIDPENPEVWFDSYGQFILGWANLGRHVEADQFVVGTELGQTIQHRERWRQIIASVRMVFSGELTYAASWDEADKISFWSDLDYVGVDFYFPVTDRKNPGRLEILAGWQPWLKRINALHNRTRKSIVFTEIGYRSIDGAGMNPHQFGTWGTIDLEEQADLYWAALQVTSETAWISGMFWWNWLADGSGGQNNRDYTPFDKPAESILKEFWVVP